MLIFIQLHWLPIAKCIKLKIFLPTFKALHDESPSHTKFPPDPYKKPVVIIWPSFKMRLL